MYWYLSTQVYPKARERKDHPNECITHTYAKQHTHTFIQSIIRKNPKKNLKHKHTHFSMFCVYDVRMYAAFSFATNTCALPQQTNLWTNDFWHFGTELCASVQMMKTKISTQRCSGAVLYDFRSKFLPSKAQTKRMEFYSLSKFKIKQTGWNWCATTAYTHSRQLKLFQTIQQLILFAQKKQNKIALHHRTVVDNWHVLSNGWDADVNKTETKKKKYSMKTIYYFISFDSKCKPKYWLITTTSIHCNGN